MLDTEYRTFEDLRAELLRKFPDQFVLIVGEELVGAYASHDEAYAEGIERFGRRDMLIKRVTAAEEEEPAAVAPALFVGLTDATSPRSSS